MKVIELLNKIANGESPKNIKYNNTDYYLYDNYSYLRTDKSRFFDTIYFKELNDEVEIIEEDKKIEKLVIGKDDIAWCEGNMKTDEEMVDIVLEIKDKINEIIDYLEENK